MLKNISDQKICLKFSGVEKDLLPGETIEFTDEKTEKEMLAHHYATLKQIIKEQPKAEPKPEPKVEPKKEAPKKEVKKNANIGNKRRNNK